MHFSYRVAREMYCRRALCEHCIEPHYTKSAIQTYNCKWLKTSIFSVNLCWRAIANVTLLSLKQWMMESMWAGVSSIPFAMFGLWFFFGGESCSMSSCLFFFGCGAILTLVPGGDRGYQIRHLTESWRPKVS